MSSIGGVRINNAISQCANMCEEGMDHSPINQNFDLNKSRQNSIIASKSITKLVIFQSFVAKCCKMRII